MGAPAISYSAPRTRAKTINAPKSNINVNQALGLRSSPYEGLQQVGKQNLYYGDGGFYESYSPSPRQYGRMTIGGFSPLGISPYTGRPYQPSYHPIFGYGGGISARGGDEAGTIRRDGQAFKPYSGDIPEGFVETDDGVYEPSMAYIYSKSQPNIKAQPNRMFTTISGYTPARGGLLPAVRVDSDSGAGQYLGGNLLGSGISFSAPKASK